MDGNILLVLLLFLLYCRCFVECTDYAHGTGTWRDCEEDEESLLCPWKCNDATCHVEHGVTQRIENYIRP